MCWKTTAFPCHSSVPSLEKTWKGEKKEQTFVKCLRQTHAGHGHCFFQRDLPHRKGQKRNFESIKGIQHGQTACKKKTLQLWNGFWQNAVQMESQKNKNLLTVVQSKEEKKKKKLKSAEVEEEDIDNIPISQILLHLCLSFWELWQKHWTKTKY